MTPLLRIVSVTVTVIRSKIKRFAKLLSKGNEYDEVFDAINVAVVHGKKIIIDGHHRTKAAIRAGIDKVPVRVVQVSKERGDELYEEMLRAYPRR